MAPRRLHRAIRRTLTVFVVIAMVSASPVAATAQPVTESDAVEQYRELNVEAEKVHQDLLQAQEDQTAKQAELDKATADLATATTSAAQAKDREQQFRGKVADLSDATFRGARFDKLSALLTGTSQRDFLDRSSALTVLATESSRTLAEMSDAIRSAAIARVQATEAQGRATAARDAAAKLTAEIAVQSKAVDTKVATVKAELDKLTAEDKKELAGPPETVQPGPPVSPPPGPPTRTPTSTPPRPPANPPPAPPAGAPADAATRAVNAALSRRGDTYVFGGSKPGAFDCSGLTMWSYAQAGIAIPRTSRSQFGIGRPVTKDQLQPGDLLFYGNSAATIHHVAMYIGGGSIVHASTFGVPVKSAPIANGGKDYFGAKRVVG